MQINQDLQTLDLFSITFQNPNVHLKMVMIYNFLEKSKVFKTLNFVLYMPNIKLGIIHTTKYFDLQHLIAACLDWINRALKTRNFLKSIKTFLNTSFAKCLTNQ